MATTILGAGSSNSVNNCDCDDTEESTRHPNRVPRRILHFCDGTLEEYSDEEEEEETITKETSKELTAVDPKTLAWGAWFWYQTVLAGSKTLEVCDYLGEALANFFGVTTPKYQFEINHYEQMVAEEEALKKRMDMEMGGWVKSDGNDSNPVTASSGDSPTQRQEVSAEK